MITLISRPDQCQMPKFNYQEMTQSKVWIMLIVLVDCVAVCQVKTRYGHLKGMVE